MKIRDPLYGTFTVPPHIERLLQTPEVRRLTGVRLLNVASVSLATLGELRRYSHTLGVLRLAREFQGLHISEPERRSFEAAVLFHDAGTPPFGHLLEYCYRERTGGTWHHEGQLADLLWARHAPENRAHQLFGKREPTFRKSLDREGISSDIVEQIIMHKHPLSALLFGSIDLDNLDNVFRMGWAIGEREDFSIPLQLARELDLDEDGELCGCESAVGDLLDVWLRLRRRVYEILLFDSPTVAAQAVLSTAMRKALEQDLLSEIDWTLSDEELLQRLSEEAETKELLQRDYFGLLPELSSCIWLRGTLDDLGFKSRSDATREVESALNAAGLQKDSYVYVFEDRGALEKGVRLRDRTTRGYWSRGCRSESVVIYCFSRRREVGGGSRRTNARFLRECFARYLDREKPLPQASPARGMSADGQFQIPGAT